MNKRAGDEKYYIIISFIVGIMILGLALIFIFREYFNQDEVDYNTCWQSLTLRSGNLINEGKDLQEMLFNIRCKTQVININFENKEKAEKLIADEMVDCLKLYGGKNLFSRNFLNEKTMCFHCARIHFTDKVKNYYTGSNFIRGVPQVLQLSDFLTSKMGSSSQTYQNFLYGAPDSTEKQISSNAFKDITYLGIGFPSDIQSNEGDIIISVVYSVPSTFSLAFPAFFSNANKYEYIVFPWKAEKDNLNCEALTIPA